jgi:NitT/TauT family transport system ATP-binding protein
MTTVSALARRAGAQTASGGNPRSPAPPAPPAKIELTGVTKRFVSPTGSLLTAIRDVDLLIEPGQFCAIVGPTGCGKSTTLSLVSGLARPSAGSVRVGGQEVDGIATGMSFMFQADALLPWKTVLGNVALGPQFAGVPKKEAQTEAREWLRRVGLNRIRGPPPPPALGRHAQAHQSGRGADQQAVDPVDGRAVRCP